MQGTFCTVLAGTGRMQPWGEVQPPRATLKGPNLSWCQLSSAPSKGGATWALLPHRAKGDSHLEESSFITPPQTTAAVVGHSWVRWAEGSPLPGPS